MKAAGVPGAVLGIVKSGHLDSSVTFGFSNLEYSSPVSEGTVFDLGTLSVEFTAALVLRLVANGHFGEHGRKASLRGYLTKSFENSLHKAVANDKAVYILNTLISQLLCHVHGFDNQYWTTVHGVDLLEHSRERLELSILNTKRNDEPGPFQFSAEGYALLALVIEASAETKDGAPSFASVMQDRLFNPLGMQATRVLGAHEIHGGERAHVYVRSEPAWGLGEWKAAETSNTEAVWRRDLRRQIRVDLRGHDGMFSNLGDLVKWEGALSTTGGPDGGEGAFATSLELMWCKRVRVKDDLDYGFGWYLRDITLSGKTYPAAYNIGHTGVVHLRIPRLDLAAILLTNRSADRDWRYEKELLSLSIEALNRAVAGNSQLLH